MQAEAGPSPHRAGDILAGRYRLVRLLGEGGMGYVWEGEQLATQKPVAIKSLKGEASTERARLVREARLVAALSHRHIVQVFDFCEEEEGPVFLVMELLRGETLAEFLARSGHLAFAEARDVGLALASAMRFAHARGIVHRDLKPENVFLGTSEDGGPPEIKVLDFGIARPTRGDGEASSLTRTGSTLGTPYYMSPEQIYAEKDIDGRADVWSLGVILYECLTGTKPFEAESYGQIFRKVTKRELVPLAAVAPTAPLPMCELVMRMLTVDRAARPTSAAVFDELEVMSSRPTSPTQWLPSMSSSDRPAQSPSSEIPPPLPSATTPPGRERPEKRTVLVASTALAALAVAALAFAFVGRARPTTVTTHPPPRTPGDAADASTLVIPSAVESRPLQVAVPAAKPVSEPSSRPQRAHDAQPPPSPAPVRRPKVAPSAKAPAALDPLGGSRF